MTDIRSMEHHTLKVPYELLNKKFRLAQKVLDREASHVQAAANDLEKALKNNLAAMPKKTYEIFEEAVVKSLNDVSSVKQRTWKL